MKLPLRTHPEQGPSEVYLGDMTPTDARLITTFRGYDDCRLGLKPSNHSEGQQIDLDGPRPVFVSAAEHRALEA